MLSKFRDLSKFNMKKGKVIDIAAIKNELCDGLFQVMEKSFAERKMDLDNSQLSSQEIDQIIQYYSKRNRLLATAAAIVPGPFGILSALPELLLNFGNQMDMIYDLGCAYGKESFINKDLLLDIPIAAFGGNTNLSFLQNNLRDLSDAPRQILLEKASLLSQSLVERTLKKSIVQFIPVAGPVLMGTWSKMTTAKISKRAMAFLDNANSYSEHLKPQEDEAIQQALLIEKIKSLANLIEANNEINEQQIDLIGTIIENADLDRAQKEYYLHESLKTGSNFQLDYNLLKAYEEEEDLLLQLIIMAKRSGQIDEQEKTYIHSVGKDLDLKFSFVENLF
ncbi:MAG: EcsC family protein [Bacteroidota bacterium]